MVSVLNLEHHMDSWNKLLVNLDNITTEMQNLSSASQNELSDIDRLTNSYLLNVNECSLLKKNKTMNRIQRLFTRLKSCGDDTVEMALLAFNLVVDYIQTFKLEMEQFLAEFQVKNMNQLKERESNLKKRKHRKKPTIKEKKKKGKKIEKGGTTAALVSVITNPTNPTTSEASVPGLTSSLTGALNNNGVDHSCKLLDDMPVEPTYCLCNDIFHGKMIACDNPNCNIQWFHFECVELNKKPKGKWFCPKCITDRKKKI